MGTLHYGAQWKPHYTAQGRRISIAAASRTDEKAEQTSPALRSSNHRVSEQTSPQIYRHSDTCTRIKKSLPSLTFPPIRREKGLTSQEALHRIPSIIVDICVAPGLDPTFVPTYLVVPRHWSSWARICDSTVIVYYQVWLDTRIVQRSRRRVEVLLFHSLKSVPK